MATEPKNRSFPEGMEPLGNRTFYFQCHPGVSCYTRCCRDLKMYLYPFDILRLKKALAISSADFLTRYATITAGDHPYFPAVMMRMAENDEKTCPFLGNEGCTVYGARPSACRTYPLERAVDRTVSRGRPEEYYFLTNHPYCKGHHESKLWRVREWIRDQGLLYDNLMADLWAEMDTLFRSNPWDGEGVAGPKQQFAFMVCYNIDGFRDYCQAHGVLDQYRLDQGRKRDIEQDDEALLKFGFDLLQFLFAGKPTLRPRRQG